MNGRLSISVDSVQPIENEVREVNRVQSCSPKEDNEKPLKETEEGWGIPLSEQDGRGPGCIKHRPTSGVGASQYLISFQTEEVQLN